MTRIFLQSQDTYFINTFMNYVSGKYSDMQFMGFTDAEAAAEYLHSSKRRWDIMICDENSSLPETGAEKIYFSERTSFADPAHSTLNIYQSANSIVADIRTFLAAAGKRVSGDTSLVAVFSVQGGSGKTTLAYALAVAAVREGKQALYLNFEETPSYSQLYNHIFSRPLDDFIYKLQEGADVGNMLMDIMERNEHNVAVLPPFHSVEDMLSLTKEQSISLLKTAVKCMGMDYIFVDLPNGYHRICESLLGCSSTVIHVFSDGECGRDKMRRMLDEDYYHNIPLFGQSLFVLNKSRSKEAEPGIDGRIPYSGSLDNNVRVADVLDRNPAFYDGCKQILAQVR